MAIVITASVGRMGGANRLDDVRKIQNALNRVPVSEGGPKQPLEVDGLCGTKTIEAIQTFQLRHFGWKGADGRVDPKGQTLAKLSQYDLPGSKVHMLSIRSALEPGRFLDPRRSEHWFFEITDPAERARAVYHLKGDFDRSPSLPPLVFLGVPRTFPCAHPAAGLGTRGAVFQTTYTVPLGGNPDVDELEPLGSTLKLALLSSSAPGGVVLVGQGIMTLGVEHLTIHPDAHIEPRPPIEPGTMEPVAVPPVVHGWMPFRSKFGRFDLVKSLQG